MKFSITRSKFLEGLRSVQNIVGAKTTSPVMQNALIEAADGILKMTTTDLDISINCQTECEVAEPGRTTLPVKILFSMISCSAEGKIDVEVDEDQKASIRAGSAKYRLSGIKAEEFPALPASDDSFSYTVPQAVVKEMLRKTAYAASQDETRRTLRGVMMSFKDGSFTMVATDGRRLALVEKDFEIPADQATEVILPSKSVQEIQRALGSEGDAVIKIQGTQIRFNLGNVTIYSKLVADKYPNYTQVIPASCDNTINIDRQLLITAIERVNVMTSDLHSTKLKFGGNMLVVSSSASDIGEAKDELPVKYEGEEIEIMFNPTYLLDALKAIDDDEVKMCLNNGHSPAVIRCSVPFIYVIMPLRVN